MNNVKPWYMSKTILSDILTVIVGAMPLIDKDLSTHMMGSHSYAAVIAFLGAYGIYGRVTADSKIG